jgi:hypothetical protein
MDLKEGMQVKVKDALGVERDAVLLRNLESGWQVRVNSDYASTMTFDSYFRSEEIISWNKSRCTCGCAAVRSDRHSSWCDEATL